MNLVAFVRPSDCLWVFLRSCFTPEFEALRVPDIHEAQKTLIFLHFVLYFYQDMMYQKSE